MTFSSTGSPAVAAARPRPSAGRADLLVEAARDLASETGSAAFTVAQVTTRAGLSFKAFYGCFHGKDDLLLALLAADSRRGVAVLETRIGTRRGADATEAYVIELFDMLGLPGALGYASILVREYRRLAEQHNRELRDALAPLVDLLARDLSTADPERDARTMFGVILDGIHEVVVHPDVDRAELARYIHRFCTQGVG